MSSAVLTVEWAEGLSPDAASLKNGRKLANQAAKWSDRGRSDAALWGAFQGSGKTPYQVRVDLAGPAWKCSCPSRKLPCKHALGLLIGAAGSDAFCPAGDPPDWVAEWLSKRASTAQAKATKAAAQKKPADPKAQAKRRAARERKIADGLDRLTLWLDDRLRQGLAELEVAGPGPFEEQAARLVDAQAPGLAARMRALSEIPGSGPDWPDRLLAGFASLRLLIVAYQNQDGLPEGLREDVRSLIGWNRTERETIDSGERVNDAWLTLGSIEWEEDRVRGRRTWLKGIATGRTAEVVQFSAYGGYGGGQGFAETFVDGCVQAMELAFHPSAAPRRAVVVGREAEPVPVPLPPGTGVAGLLDETADELAACPFRTIFVGVLSGVTPLVGGGGAADGWWLRDEDGAGVRLARGDWWELLAESGGRPLTVAGEYATDAPGGPRFRPLRWDAGVPEGGTPGPADTAGGER
ncbi:SWIM zinc finger family protein [Alienimonas sp. DA493]|uniref:SWIM zinc finger family protein n=1 Tax=Alienimonas sp. DA493 TaxID=3373605 RepID=UPI003754C9A3